MLTRVEQKFFVPPGKLPLVQALIRCTCRWDPEYPQGQINSLYFDTWDLEQHGNSLAGELVKDKVRVRWYGKTQMAAGKTEVAADSAVDNQAGDAGTPSSAVDEQAGDAGTPSASHLVPVWVELKSRRGFVSTKQRVRTEVGADRLAFHALSRGIVPASYLLSTVAGFGFLAPRGLEPVIAISYWRCRFVEPCTGFRVSLDSQIRSSMVMRGPDYRGMEIELRGAVVEVKGDSERLPRCLLELAEIGSSWTRYSKYSASLEAHYATPGEVSWLWPAGTVQAEPCTAQSYRGEEYVCGQS